LFGHKGPACSSTQTLKRSLNAQAWALAWPMMLSNISTPMLGLVDAAIMGHLSDSRYLAAIAVGGTIFSSLYWALGFLKAGTTGLAAQAYGLNDHVFLKELMWRALALALSLGLCFVLLQKPIFALSQWIFQPPDLSAAALAQYYKIRIWGAPAALMTLVLIGWFVGNHNTRVPLVVLLSTNCVNAVLSLLLVLGFGMKAQGVAWGTVIGEYFGLGLALFSVRRWFLGQGFGVVLKAISAVKPLVGLIKINADYFIRTLFLIFTFAFFTRQGSLMGPDTLAVNEILKTFLLIIALALDGYAHAAEALVGSSWAAKKEVEFRISVKIIFFWSILCSLMLSLVFAVAGPFILTLLTDLPELLLLADQYFFWIIVLPLISVWSFMLDGLFIGIADTRAMRNNMIFTVLCIFLPLWFMAKSLGNHGLWFAMMGFFLGRGLGLGVVFYRRYWMPKLT